MERQRTALIVGSAQGIGLASAQQIAQTGAHMVLVDVNAEALDRAAATIDKNSRQVLTYVANATDPLAIADVVADVTAKTGCIDILVNIAGGTGGSKSLHQIDEIDLDVWDDIIALNLRSTYLSCRAVVPTMRKQRYGRIVNTSSTLARGRHGPVGAAGARLPYAAAKAGVLGFTSQLAKDVGQYNITVNAVMPWLTFTERAKGRFEKLTQEGRNEIMEHSPFGRAAEVKEIAAAVAFFASDEASFVSGVAMPVDGAFL
jgi:NAD(P)-dependent dehydrogenase (short-subunit alcohol dehydrogenase family)